MTGRRFTVVFCVALIALAVAAPAQAAFPGQNGRIAFTGFNSTATVVDIFSAEPNGDAVLQVTHDGVSHAPVFSPDGARLAFASGSTVYIADQYGNDPQFVIDIGVGPGEMDWSPDGTRLVASFPNCADFDCEYDIYVFGTDGSGLTNLTSTAFSELNPSWSPDGSKIAFDADVSGNHDVFTINPDGTGLQNITADLAARAAEPDWSPDGSKIAFEGYLANPDGSGRTPTSVGSQPAWSPDGTRFAYQGDPPPPVSQPAIQVTGPHAGFYGALGLGEDPDWQVRQPDPVPPTGGTRFLRPKGATPLAVSLVPKYLGCTHPTKQHGPPLAYGSCVPSRSGTRYTIGTPDSNGLPAEGAGFVRFKSIVGNPATVADEADVRIRVQQTDVRGAFAPYQEFTGGLELFVVLRTTDLWNAGDGSGPAGTIVEFPLHVLVPCAATPGPEGALCSVDTTMDAVLPDFVREGTRTILQLGPVELRTPGISTDPFTLDDNRPLLTQGVYVP